MPYPISFPIGSLVPLASVHHPTSVVWELEMHHGLDNRLNHEFIDKALFKALDLVEKDWRSSTTEVGAPGALIIVGKKSQQKFWSNGAIYACLCGHVHGRQPIIEQGSITIQRRRTPDSSPVCAYSF
jgi:hypothetical protein